jgi:hypothetical protein
MESAKKIHIKKKFDVPFVLLSVLMIISMVIIVCYCDIEVWPCFEMIAFLQRRSEDKTLYDLAIGYVSAYVFYLIQVYFPEKERQKEETINRVPLRMAAYVLLYNTIELILHYYYEVVRVKYVSKNINETELPKQIIDASNEIQMDKQLRTHKSPYLFDSWRVYTLFIMKKVEDNNLRLVDNYHDILPSWIIDDLMYLNNESHYVGRLKEHLEDYCPDVLGTCFPPEHPDGDTRATLAETVNIIENILRWLKNERMDLLKYGKTPKLVYWLCFWLPQGPGIKKGW